MKFSSHRPVDDKFEKPFETIALHKMISHLLCHFQKKAVLQQSFLVNDVSQDFYVSTDKNTLAKAISHLFNSLIPKTRNSCIRVSAKRYSNIILLRISNTNGAIGMINNNCWHEIKIMADWLGGCILMDEVRQKPSNITFSFRCLANAA